MFDLEKALAAWRDHLRCKRVFLPEDIEELEGHLRDLVARLTASGMDEEEAFHRAIRRMGADGFLEAEYRKVRFVRAKRNRHLGLTIYWSLVMLKNYLKTTFRGFRRHKGYTLLNITGLSVGIALSLLALLYVEHERSYDRFHSKADRIYRVVQDIEYPGQPREYTALTSFNLADGLIETFPEVMKATGINFRSEFTLLYGDKRFSEHARFEVDPSFLDIFDIEFVRGDPETALEDPHALVITEELARKYFGEEDPIGKTVTEGNSNNGLYVEQRALLTVTGVVRNMPVNSHFHFDALQRRQFKGGEYQWRSPATYVLLPEDYPPERLEDKFPAFVDTWNWGDWEEWSGVSSWEEAVRSGQAHWRLRLQPLTDIHLDAQYDIGGDNYNRGFEPPGNQTTIKLLSLIAFFILILACINFMNLATARSAKRLTEVGIRKVVGSSRAQLVRQFLFESIMLSLLALLVATVLVALALPAFNGFLGTDITFGLFQSAHVVPGMIVVALTVGILAGSYPAFFLSSFRPVALLKGTCQAGTRGVSLRNGLVVFQLLISILLIVAAAVVYKQLSFMREKDLGFSGEQVLVLENVLDAFWSAEGSSFTRLLQEHGYSVEEWIDMTDEERGERIAASGGTLVNYRELTLRRIKTFKEQLLQMPGVLRVSHSEMVPGRILQPDEWGGFTVNDGWLHLEGGINAIKVLATDADLFETLQVEILAGRITDEDEQAHRLVINEAAAKLLGTDHVIGQSFTDLLIAASEGQWNGIGEELDAPLAAVVKDFHWADLHIEIQPTLFWLGYRYWFPDNIMVRIRTGEIEATLASMEHTWKQFIADVPMEYVFLDDDFGKLFEAEVRLGKTFGFFAALAIFIACLGLFGLAAFMAEQRTKEIGIRKVLGASARDIVQLLSKNFLWLLLIGNLVAWPIGYLVMQRWLEDFAYRIEIGVGVFLVTGAVALVLVLISVGGQAIRASLTNPVESLRYE